MLQKIRIMMHEILIIVYYIHAISTIISFYLCHATSELPNNEILYRSFILNYYLILLSYLINNIYTMSSNYVILVLIYYAYIYSITANYYAN